MADEKDSKWQCYIIPDLATWTGAAGSKPYTPIEFYDSYKQAATRFQELRSESYNSEEVPGARLTFGVQREEPPSAADLLHVRQGQNYLVDDYTRMASLNQSPEVMDILRQMRKDLGFDRVRVYEQGAMEPKDVTFSRWKHPLKPSLRKSVLKELKETRPKEAAAKLPRPQAQRKGPGIKGRRLHVRKNTLLRATRRGHRPPPDRKLGAVGRFFIFGWTAVQVPLP